MRAGVSRKSSATIATESSRGRCVASLRSGSPASCRNSPSRSGNPMGERGKNTVLVIFSLLVGLLLCEAALRIYSGISILSVSNFRGTQGIQVFMNDATVYDPVLGWTVKPFYANHTIDYGIRKNRPEDTGLRTGGILVAGSSWAAEIGRAHV